MADSAVFPKESLHSWKVQAFEKLTRLTQDLVIFTGYVHLYGKLTFDIDGKEVGMQNLKLNVVPCPKMIIGATESVPPFAALASNFHIFTMIWHARETKYSTEQQISSCFPKNKCPGTCH